MGCWQGLSMKMWTVQCTCKPRGHLFDTLAWLIPSSVVRVSSPKDSFYKWRSKRLDKLIWQLFHRRQKCWLWLALPYNFKDWADSGREFDPPAGLRLITQPFDQFFAHHELMRFFFKFVISFLSRNRNFYHNLITFVHFHSCNFLIANLVIYLTFLINSAVNWQWIFKLLFQGNLGSSHRLLSSWSNGINDRII